VRLSDHIIAEVGKSNDIEGIFKSMAAAIRQAERFELSDDVAIAAYRLTTQKPTTLLSALPLVRSPYRKIWLEWRGGQTTRTGMIRPANRRDQSFAPDPLKQGVLIETDETGQRGIMTFAWVHKHRPEAMREVLGPEGDDYTGVNICPLGTLFNWQEGAIVSEDAIELLHRRYPTDAAKRSPAGTLDLLMSTKYTRRLTDEELKAWMERSAFHDWSRHAKNASERRALATLGQHAMLFLSPHAQGFFGWCAARAIQSDELLHNFLNQIVRQSWEMDIEGEPPMAETVIAMMNSRNAIEHRPVDLAALNKARAKRGRPIFMGYRTTHLRLSQAQQRAFRAGLMTREQAGRHTVRGHFKVRKTGIYWWSPFERGDPTRQIERQEYVVQ
jgi:hypothetical protein